VFSGTRRQLILAASIVAIVLAAGGGWYYGVAKSPAATVIPFSEFLQHVEAGRVRDLVAGDAAFDAKLADGRQVRTVAPAGYLTANPATLAALARQRARVEVRPAIEGGFSLGPVAIALGFFAVVSFAIYRSTAGRIPSLERSARVADKTTGVITFADVAGVDEAKDEVKEIVDFLREPERFSVLGGRIPKGVLLVGPPGTGKTLLARSIAGEAAVPFVFASGADFVEMYAGVGASRVRRLFREARRHKSCIVFIDEIDAVGRSRGGTSLSHEEREQTLNQLLVEMDGFEAHQGTVVIAATNRPDILDPALLRPGRFDRQVTVGNPDLKGREAILGVHTRKVSMAPDVELRKIARGTPGFSGADLANLVNEAALLAGRAGRSSVTGNDLEAARDKVLMGVERRSVVLSQADRVNCAYHEAGHAVVAAVLPTADPLHKVTIIPRGRAMGVTMQLPEADRHTYTKEYLESQLAILMGGRAAEEIFMGHMTSGAASDIERATDIAQRMVCEFGMSTLGPRAFRQAQRDEAAGLSTQTAQRVDDEVERLVIGALERARTLLDTHRAGVRALAEQLLELESLDADEICQVLTAAGTPVPPRQGMAERALA